MCNHLWINHGRIRCEPALDMVDGQLGLLRDSRIVVLSLLPSSPKDCEIHLIMGSSLVPSGNSSNVSSSLLLRSILQKSFSTRYPPQMISMKHLGRWSQRETCLFSGGLTQWGFVRHLVNRLADSKYFFARDSAVSVDIVYLERH